MENDASGPDLLPGPSIAYSNDASGTYLIQVTDGTSGTQYTLSLSTS